MKIKLLSEDAQLPSKATTYSAGFDLYVPKNTVIKPGRNIIPLDFAVAIPFGMEGQIRPRSGFSAKGIEGYPYLNVNGATNKPQRYNADVLLGTIDSDYRGCVGVLVDNHENIPFVVVKGTRIAQLVVAPYTIVDIEECLNLDDTERGDGGFGHSGVK